MDKIYKTKENTESIESSASECKGSYFVYPGLQKGVMKPLITDITELIGWVALTVILAVMLVQVWY